jgi:hypothetical protein
MAMQSTAALGALPDEVPIGELQNHWQNMWAAGSMNHAMTAAMTGPMVGAPVYAEVPATEPAAQPAAPAAPPHTEAVGQSGAPDDAIDLTAAGGSAESQPMG